MKTTVVVTSNGNRLAVSLGAGLAIILAFLLGIAVASRTDATHGTPSEIALRMAACIKERAAAVALPKPDVATFDALTEGCYRSLYKEYLLADFSIRQAKFTEQSRDALLLLAVVITVTLAGVGLSGLQFMSSYLIASQNKAHVEPMSELSIERDRITLKSSVTGLMMLACSLAFFSIFVIRVHPIQESAATTTAAPSPAVQTDSLPLLGEQAPPLSKP